MSMRAKNPSAVADVDVETVIVLRHELVALSELRASRACDFISERMSFLRRGERA